jgi:hypothetical protein
MATDTFTVLTFNRTYFLFAVILFVVEVLIALFIHDNFVRPYLGDYLVVILIYCSVKSVMRASPLKVAIGTLLFAFLIEFLQYLNILKLLGWQDSSLAKVVMGNSFAWHDILAYTLGVVSVLMIEKFMVNS